MPSCQSCPATRSSAGSTQIGDGVTGFAVGERIGVPWLGYSCDECRFCRERRENLCREARFTGYQLDGGYAEYAVADARYAFKLPDAYGDAEAAPLLCAGLIGYRSYRMTGDPGRLGLYGFGAAAHIIAQVAVQETREVYAFTSPGDTAAQQFAMSLGAVWAGSSTEPPPRPLDAAIIFAPVGALVPEALSRVGPGGVVVCAGIHMSDIPSFPYAPSMGGAGRPIGRKPHEAGCDRVSGAGRADAHQDARGGVSPRRGQ